jgi:hypothetical protein
MQAQEPLELLHTQAATARRRARMHGLLVANSQCRSCYAFLGGLGGRQDSQSQGLNRLQTIMGLKIKSDDVSDVISDCMSAQCVQKLSAAVLNTV